ncbi:hypothetical protein [Streptomyces lutosisoli]|uniref:Amino acid transporter n=1 Tax=Streptomyces lutosisoli TaxID=2665721 RepID=A0ABW2V8I9_9ACTN
MTAERRHPWGDLRGLKTRTRSTAFSIAWGLCVAVFGGAAPFISTALIAGTGNTESPALMIVVACILTAGGYLWFREPARNVEP